MTVTRHVRPVGLVGRLSDLIVDVDKDWLTHVIKNLGAPVDPTDALRLAELTAHVGLPNAHHTAHYPTLADHPLSIIPTMDDCVSEDTEILTADGWKTHDKLKKGELVLTLNIETKKLEYNPILAFHYYRGKNAYHIKTRSFDGIFSPKHRHVIQKPRWKGKVTHGFHNRLEFARTEELTQNVHFPVAGIYDGKEDGFSDEFVELLAWVITDGCFDEGSNPPRIEIIQGEENREYREEIKKLLTRLGVRWNSLSQEPSDKSATKQRVYYYRLGIEATRRVLSVLGSNIHKIPRVLLNLPQKQLKLFFNTLIKGDGTFRKLKTPYYHYKLKKRHRSYQFSTVRKHLADGLQELCIKIGKRAVIGINDNKQGFSSNPCYDVSISDKDFVSIRRRFNLHPVENKGVMWCVTTRNGTFVARRNGRAFITGNSHIPDLETLSYGGPFATAQIPNLDASKITSGVFDQARIPWTLIPASGITIGGDCVLYRVAANVFRTLDRMQFGGDINTDIIYEDTADAGVTIDSVLCKDGMVRILDSGVVRLGHSSGQLDIIPSFGTDYAQCIFQPNAGNRVCGVGLKPKGTEDRSEIWLQNYEGAGYGALILEIDGATARLAAENMGTPSTPITTAEITSPATAVWRTDSFEPRIDNTYHLGASGLRYSKIHVVAENVGELGFSDTICRKCGESFKVGEELTLKVIEVSAGYVETVPVHRDCQEKTFSPLAEGEYEIIDEHVLDEEHLQLNVRFWDGIFTAVPIKIDASEEEVEKLIRKYHDNIKAEREKKQKAVKEGKSKKKVSWKGKKGKLK